MKIKNFLFVPLAALAFFLRPISLFAQDVTGNGSAVSDFLAQYSQYAYTLIVWIFGVLIKRYGDRVPILNQLSETAYRVLAFGLLLAVAFWQFGGDTFFEYMRTYGVAATLYVLGLKEPLNKGGEILLGPSPTKHEAA